MVSSLDYIYHALVPFVIIIRLLEYIVNVLKSAHSFDKPIDDLVKLSNCFLNDQIFPELNFAFIIIVLGYSFAFV